MIYTHALTPEQLQYMQDDHMRSKKARFEGAGRARGVEGEREEIDRDKKKQMNTQCILINVEHPRFFFPFLSSFVFKTYGTCDFCVFAH